MNEPVTLLLLQHLLPEWTITRDEQGTWTATTHITAPDLAALLTKLHTTAPAAVAHAEHLLTERRGQRREAGALNVTSG